MENPEEILHSLEEFAKMKPKDIPRELEEYLKFVAKTGDPVYQWPAIKSLFREKLINVITEFYESCSSMEIPPCPNVEMFNYDLMKNFILEKLDTFASAPFTLQRICELLTSPRKEYTRIDKYMRALEKNILVVSTMEPGGRRTENGDGVMNGIESDHEHVPEPGNEINVEEMDDSPSWPQSIQTNNHIAEPISFDNPENDYHVSSTNQEIVCVQYVSVEPLASENLQIQNEEVKESDVSVTITALNIKKDEDPEETSTPEPESLPAIEPAKETTAMAIIDQDIEKTEVEAKMDLQTIEHISEPIENALKDESKYVGETVLSDPDTADILPTTTSEKHFEPSDPVQGTSLESENAEIETVSPENSVTSSEDSPTQSNTLTDVLSHDVTMENSSNLVEVSESPKETSEVQEIKEDNEILETDSPGDVDSTTKVSEEDHIITDDIKVSDSTDSEVILPEVKSQEESSSGQDTQKGENESSTMCNDDVTETSVELDEKLKVETTSEVLVEQEQPKQEEAAEVTSEEILKPDELPEKSEVPAFKPIETSSEISIDVEEKETPMEVDTVPGDLLDSSDKDKATVEESKASELPV